MTAEGACRPRVVDFSTHLSGPVASQLLVQLGADVIKVENPRVGDGNRGMFPLINGQGLFHVALNPGTRSLAIDRRSDAWPRVVKACAQWADVVIVGAPPASAARLGIDFDSMRAHNDRIVYVAITGYGLTGPWAGYLAHGLNLDALAGVLPLDWDGDRPEPRADYQSSGTTLAGVFAALGAMAALYQAGRSGEARFVHASIWGAAMWWNWRNLTCSANLGEPWFAYKDLGSRYATYATAEGRAVLVCPIERRFWERFCDLLDLPAEWKAVGDWSASAMDYGKGRDEEAALIGSRMRAWELDDIVRRLDEAEIPFAPVLTAVEAMTSQHARDNGVMREVLVDGRPTTIPRSPLSVRAAERHDAPAEEDAPATPPPALGQDTSAVLRELGLPDLDLSGPR